jgi:polysaccharide export outer membrane protein
MMQTAIRFRSLVVVLGALMFLALACAWPAAAAQRDVQTRPQTAATPSTRDVLPDYEVAPEDVLEISVWKEEGLTKDVVVRPDGGISFPLAGDMQAAGKTAQEIQLEITRRLMKYMAEPVVSVTVMKVAGNKIYVMGKVNKPGEYLAGRYLNVLQALSLAGGLTPFAAEDDIKVVRRQGDRELVFPFNYAEVRKGRKLEQNILLRGGDVVVVP